MSGETEQAPSGWTVDTALEFLTKRHEDLVKANTQRFDQLVIKLDERFDTQSKALDAALIAQQMAMHTAFDAADKAVQAALKSAEKAVEKAEKSANERFAAVNEFRQTLSDQTATFMARSETESRIQGVIDKLETNILREDQRLAEINKRLDLTAGKDNGGEVQTAKLYALIGAIGSSMGILLAIAALVGVFVNRGGA